MTVKVQTNEQIEQATSALEQRAENISNVTYTAPTETGEAQTVAEEDGQRQRVASEAAGMPRVGRNDPCPCGSGKKFKQCHGKLA